MLVLFFAAARLGLILVPLNWRLALPEIKFIVADCVPSAIFFDESFAENVPTILAGQNHCHQIHTGAEEATSIEPKKASTPPAHHNEQAELDNNGDSPLMIVYTSGTTGHPKGAVLSHKSFACNARMSQHMHDMEASDHILSFLPMFHVGGFNIQMLPALSLGATVTLLEKFDPANVVEALNTRAITLTLCVPTILKALLDNAAWSPSKGLLKSISIGSTDVPIGLIETINHYNIPLLQVYGTTETSPLAIYQRLDNAFNTVGSIGRGGSECKIKLVDETGQDVEIGNNGEIWVKGDNILSSYWNNEAATQSNIVDGWFRTGDVARCDDDGFYWFADRLKHVIISGGENIYAAELERVITDFHGLSEFVVVGMKDSKWGEVAVVVGVRNPAEPAKDEVLSEHILAAFDGQIARFKHPRKVIFVDALPRTALGKVQVDAVKAMIA